MIIWGSRSLASTVEQQPFHCPQCSLVRDGKLKQLRNFFTLYFIPIIPLNVAGRYVECSSCGGTFAEEVLSYDAEQEQKEANLEMLRVMVMAALADGHVDDLEDAEIRKQYMELAGLPVTNSELQQEIQMASTSGANLNTFVGGIAPQLNAHGKALVVKLAFFTMSASGELQPGHQEQLAQLGNTLGIPEEQYKELIDQLSLPQPE